MSIKLLALFLVLAVAASFVGVNGAPFRRGCVIAVFDGVDFFPSAFVRPSRFPSTRVHLFVESSPFHLFFPPRSPCSANAASLSATAEFQLAEVADTFSSAGANDAAAKRRFCFAVHDRAGKLVRDQAALRRAAKQFASDSRYIAALCKVSIAKPVRAASFLFCFYFSHRPFPPR